jgi:hypothetical protein
MPAQRQRWRQASLPSRAVGRAKTRCAGRATPRFSVGGEEFHRIGPCPLLLHIKPPHIKPPRGRAGLAPRGPARRALVGFRTEALLRVEAALLRLAGTRRLILLRRDPSTASGLGCRRRRRGIWVARIPRNLRRGLSLAGRRVRRICRNSGSCQQYRARHRHLETLNHRRFSSSFKVSVPTHHQTINIG